MDDFLLPCSPQHPPHPLAQGHPLTRSSIPVPSTLISLQPIHPTTSQPSMRTAKKKKPTTSTFMQTSITIIRNNIPTTTNTTTFHNNSLHPAKKISTDQYPSTLTHLRRLTALPPPPLPCRPILPLTTLLRNNPPSTNINNKRVTSTLVLDQDRPMVMDQVLRVCLCTRPGHSGCATDTAPLSISPASPSSEDRNHASAPTGLEA